MSNVQQITRLRSSLIVWIDWPCTTAFQDGIVNAWEEACRKAVYGKPSVLYGGLSASESTVYENVVGGFGAKFLALIHPTPLQFLW